MRPTEPNTAFCHTLSVQQRDIDELGHVNNVVYLRWVQEVAAAHWEAVAPAELKQQYSWVVLRHEIDYLRPAFLQDTIEGYTWVEPAQGPKVARHVRLYRAGSQELLAQAKTSWCLLDAASMRPKRISEEIASTFSPPA
ncbi:acyl-CoA thioesterase [Cesiribacter andamanensis]|uniref:Acyl-ACP thioesterase n=1 Tax=Cesiribacter andamanensis AMV16 TaxID=1279009 RepID=M7N9P9_9BACT|nr:thioesterase family protein [Cesiribacter andamanensis]EMR03997.1 Acyl-ACP thioesterase [Cesiribacter andamanensis AMV16]